MERQYLFIDGAHATGVAKRATRSHVMKGKNAGRKLFRRSKLAHTPEIAKSFGYLGVSFAVEIEPWSQQVINHYFAYTSSRLYPIQLGLVLHEVMVMFLTTICADATVQACSISLMQACNEIFFANGETPPRALQHLSRTFTMVQDRVNGEEALSDSTLAIVISLFHQEQIRKQYAAARVHMEGLQRMVKLRGGIEKLESSPYLMLKTCKIDIMFALQNGRQPMFFRDNIAHVHEVLSKDGMSLTCTDSPLFERYSQLNPRFREVMQDIVGSCTLFNNHEKSTTLGAVAFLELLISICYRLLRFRLLPTNPEQFVDYQIALHLGAIIVMMTVFLQLGHRRMIDYSLISQCLYGVLDDDLLEEDPGLYLWLAVVGGIWISGDGESDWINARLQKASKQAGLRSWSDLRNYIRIFPWINTIHDRPGSELWQTAMD